MADTPQMIVPRTLQMKVNIGKRGNFLLKCDKIYRRTAKGGPVIIGMHHGALLGVIPMRARINIAMANIQRYNEIATTNAAKDLLSFLEDNPI
jgi:hypothetical protein